MKKIHIDEVKHISKLANLPIKGGELKTLRKDLSEVIDFNMSLLKDIDTTNVEPTAYSENINKMRVDEAGVMLADEEALKNASSVYNGFFKVKKILER